MKLSELRSIVAQTVREEKAKVKSPIENLVIFGAKTKRGWVSFTVAKSHFQAVGFAQYLSNFGFQVTDAKNMDNEGLRDWIKANKSRCVILFEPKTLEVENE